MGIEAGLGLTGAGGIMHAFGAYNSAKSQKSALQYQAAVAQRNAQIAREQQGIAEQNGQVAQAAQELKTAGMLGDQRAAMAANGVDLGTGSSNEVLASTKFIGNVDALTIADNASRQAWAYGEEAKGFDAEAAMTKASADSITPWMAGVGTLLSDAGTVASKWYSYKKQTGG